MPQQSTILFSEATQLYGDFVNPLWVSLLADIGILRNFVGGDGAYIADDNGNQFLDFVGGFGATALGHGHAGLAKILNEAVTRSFPGIMPWGVTPETGMLARRLCELAGNRLHKVYFASGGAEALEGALKFAACASGRNRFLVFEGGFHGLTTATTGLSGGEWSTPFPCLWPFVARLKSKNLADLESAIHEHKPAAIVLEVVQGSGSSPPWDANSLDQLSALAKRSGTFIIVDEVLTGLGRTGEWFSFASDNSSFVPDLVVVSKVLTGGLVPVSAVLMSQSIFEATFSDRQRAKIHGSTFSGARLGMTCGLAVLDIIERDGLLNNVSQTSARIFSGVHDLIGQHLVSGIIGRGLLIGIDIGGANTEMRAAAASAACLGLMDRGVLTAVGAHDSGLLRLTPPFILNFEDVDMFLNALEDTLREMRQGGIS